MKNKNNNLETGNEQGTQQVFPAEIIADEKLPVRKPPTQKQLDALKPNQFRPGVSGNPSGRPKDPVREIGKRIAAAKANKTLTLKQKKLADDLGFDTNEITVLEHLMLKLATSANPIKVNLYLERTFGKVPNVNLNAQISESLVTRFKSKLTDSELEDIAAGADVFEILLEKLPDVDGADNANDFIIDADATDE